MTGEFDETDDDFEQRLFLEIMPDAHGQEEQALSWYYYLEEQLSFPFQAECVAEASRSPLRVGERVEVIGMPPEEVCDHEMFVTVRWQGRDFAVPLAVLAVRSVDDGTRRAIDDWHTWVERGYEL